MNNSVSKWSLFLVASSHNSKKLKPIQEEWIHAEWFGLVNLRSMMRIMARRKVARTVAVLHAGRMDRDAQQEAQRIDQDMALAAGDFLARIKALRVERRAPFE